MKFRSLSRLCSSDGDRKDRQWSPARCEHDIAESVVAVERKSARVEENESR